MLERPTLGLFSIENVLKLHAPLHCAAVHKFCQKRVFHNLPDTNVVLYKIARYSKDLRIAGFLSTAQKSCDGLSVQNEKFCHGGAGPKVRSDVMVLNSKVTQIVDIF